ncbi:MAG: DUF1566 domain-containing protein [Magnetococcus sp. DMHC-6]
MKTISMLAMWGVLTGLSVGDVQAENFSVPNILPTNPATKLPENIQNKKINENFDALVNIINQLKQKVATLEGSGTQSPCTTPDSYGFCDNGNGTVTHAETGLVLLANANCFDVLMWDDAVSSVASLADGMCGLTDGSTAGEWRMPNSTQIKGFLQDIDGGELEVLYQASLDPIFTNMQPAYYWSGTTNINSPKEAWNIFLGNGYIRYFAKSFETYVWPIRNSH